MVTKWGRGKQGDRFSSIAGTAAGVVKLVCLSDTGNRFAVMEGNNISIYRQSTGEFFSGYFAKEMHAFAGARALYQIGHSPQGLSLYRESTDPLATAKTVELTDDPPRHEKWQAMTCGLAVSADESTCAVLMMDSNDYLNAGATAENPRVLVCRHLQSSSTVARPVTIIRPATSGAIANGNRYNDGRLLMLSPDGKRLLVGTVLNSRVLSAELWDTTANQPIHTFTAPDFVGEEYVAGVSARSMVTISTDRKSIRQYRWNDGSEFGSFTVESNIAAACLNSDATECIVSLGGRKIGRYAMGDGKLTGTLDCRVVPVAWSKLNDVFVGYPEKSGGTDRQILVLADCRSGSVLAILRHGALHGPAADFSADGMSLMYQINSEHMDLVRNMSPTLAVRYLQTPRAQLGEASGDLGSAGSNPAPTTDLFGQNILTLSPDAIAATDLEKLGNQLGSQVIVEGYIRSANPTRTGGHLLMEIGDGSSPVLLFIPGSNMPAFDAGYGGKFADAVLHRFVRVKGTIDKYGGKSTRLMDRLQITLTDPAQLQLIDTAKLASRPLQ